MKLLELEHVSKRFVQPLDLAGKIARSLGADVSDEELLLRWLLSKDDIAAMRASGEAKEYVTTRHPLVRLMAELTQSDVNLIQVSKPGFALKLERRAAAR